MSSDTGGPGPLPSSRASSPTPSLSSVSSTSNLNNNNVIIPRSTRSSLLREQRFASLNAKSSHTNLGHGQGLGQRATKSLGHNHRIDVDSDSSSSTLEGLNQSQTFMSPPATATPVSTLSTSPSLSLSTLSALSNRKTQRLPPNHQTLKVHSHSHNHSSNHNNHNPHSHGHHTHNPSTKSEKKISKPLPLTSLALSQLNNCVTNQINSFNNNQNDFNSINNNNNNNNNNSSNSNSSVNGSGSLLISSPMVNANGTLSLSLSPNNLILNTNNSESGLTDINLNNINNNSNNVNSSSSSSNNNNNTNSNTPYFSLPQQGSELYENVNNAMNPNNINTTNNSTSIAVNGNNTINNTPTLNYANNNNSNSNSSNNNNNPKRVTYSHYVPPRSAMTPHDFSILQDIAIIQDWLATLKQAKSFSTLGHVVAKVKRAIFTPAQVKRQRMKRRESAKIAASRANGSTADNQNANNNNNSKSTGSSAVNTNNDILAVANSTSRLTALVRPKNDLNGDDEGYDDELADEFEEYGDYDEGDLDDRLSNFIASNSKNSSHLYTSTGHLPLQHDGVVFENGRWVPASKSRNVHLHSNQQASHNTSHKSAPPISLQSSSGEQSDRDSMISDDPSRDRFNDFATELDEIPDFDNGMDPNNNSHSSQKMILSGQPVRVNPLNPSKPNTYIHVHRPSTDSLNPMSEDDFYVSTNSNTPTSISQAQSLSLQNGKVLNPIHSSTNSSLRTSRRFDDDDLDDLDDLDDFNDSNKPTQESEHISANIDSSQSSLSLQNTTESSKNDAFNSEKDTPILNSISHPHISEEVKNNITAVSSESSLNNNLGEVVNLSEVPVTDPQIPSVTKTAVPRIPSFESASASAPGSGSNLLRLDGSHSEAVCDSEIDPFEAEDNGSGNNSSAEISKFNVEPSISKSHLATVDDLSINLGTSQEGGARRTGRGIGDFSEEDTHGMLDALDAMYGDDIDGGLVTTDCVTNEDGYSSTSISQNHQLASSPTPPSTRILGKGVNESAKKGPVLFTPSDIAKLALNGSAVNRSRSDPTLIQQLLVGNLSSSKGMINSLSPNKQPATVNENKKGFVDPKALQNQFPDSTLTADDFGDLIDDENDQDTDNDVNPISAPPPNAGGIKGTLGETPNINLSTSTIIGDKKSPDIASSTSDNTGQMSGSTPRVRSLTALRNRLSLTTSHPFPLVISPILARSPSNSFLFSDKTSVPSVNIFPDDLDDLPDMADDEAHTPNTGGLSSGSGSGSGSSSFRSNPLASGTASDSDSNTHTPILPSQALTHSLSDRSISNHGPTARILHEFDISSSLKKMIESSCAAHEPMAIQINKPFVRQCIQKDPLNHKTFVEWFIHQAKQTQNVKFSPS